MYCSKAALTICCRQTVVILRGLCCVGLQDSCCCACAELQCEYLAGARAAVALILHWLPRCCSQVRPVLSNRFPSSAAAHVVHLEGPRVLLASNRVCSGTWSTTYVCSIVTASHRTRSWTADLWVTFDCAFLSRLPWCVASAQGCHKCCQHLQCWGFGEVDVARALTARLVLLED